MNKMTSWQHSFCKQLRTNDIRYYKKVRLRDHKRHTDCAVAGLVWSPCPFPPPLSPAQDQGHDYGQDLRQDLLKTHHPRKDQAPEPREGTRDQRPGGTPWKDQGPVTWDLGTETRKYGEIVILNFARNFFMLCFSTEHTLGHIFAITTSFNNGTFNEDICISSGFMLAEMICGQGMIVMITALSGMFYLISSLVRYVNQWCI